MKAYDDISKTLYIGIPLVTFSCSISSLIHFGAGRFIFSSTARRMSEKYPIFRAIDKAMLSDGLLLMVMLHMSPMVPFSILNFIIGMTAMRLQDFLFSLIAVIPGTIVFILVGTTFQDFH